MSKGSIGCIMRKDEMKEMEYKRRRHEICLCAENVFAEKGFSEATMNAVAEQYGFAVGSLYNYFKSKEDLYFSLLNSKIELFTEKTRKSILACKSSKSKDKLYAVLKVISEFYQHNRNFFILYFNEVNGFDLNLQSKKNPIILKSYNSYLKIIKKIFIDGIKSGEIKKLDASILSILFTGIIEALMKNAIIAFKKKLFPVKKEQIVEIMFEGIEAKKINGQ